jgi:ribosomal-protein-alanine N-acetyltransferase
LSGPPTRRTEHLLLRAPEPADVDRLFEIESDVGAMEFTISSDSREQTEAHIASHAARFAEDGFSPWVAVLLEEDRVVGWGGLCKDPEAPKWGVEVVYYFDRAYWGRGLATELVRAALELAFDDLGLEEVGAFARPENLASVRVLEKCGFRRLRYVPELERDEFGLTVDDYRG